MKVKQIVVHFFEDSKVIKMTVCKVDPPSTHRGLVTLVTNEAQPWSVVFAVLLCNAIMYTSPANNDP